MKKLIFTITFIFVTKQCFAHSVGYTILKNGVGMKVFYEDVEKTPMSYAEVKIYSPEDKNIEFQSGVTDKNGCFVFYPDRTGKWKIEINDGMGHGIIKEIEISEDLIPKVETTSQLPLWKKILYGISIIFGFTGVLFYILATKKVKK